MSTENNSLKTPLEKLVTDGPGETSPPKLRGWPEAYIGVLHAPPQLQTKTNNSTIENQLYSPTSDSPLGTTIQQDCSFQLKDGTSYVVGATTPKQNEKEAKGLKYDEGKPPLAYIPKAALYAEGEAFAFGAKKYEPFNYRNGIAITRTISAALRHMSQFLGGEDLDKESGVHHLGCARANLAMALDTLENHPELDDRWKGK